MSLALTPSICITLPLTQKKAVTEIKTRYYPQNNKGKRRWGERSAD